MNRILIVVITFTSTALAAHAGNPMMLGRPCSLSHRSSLEKVDHSVFDYLLHKYVDERCLVNYTAWHASAADMRALDGYLAAIGCVDLRAPATQNAKLAYWLNVYNAVTLRGILHFYPTTSIKQHVSKLGGFNIWKDLLIWVDGQLYSLDDIEHKILRKMGEPRIHFGAVCASRGCPPLRNEAYTAANVIASLNHNAQLFFSQPSNFRADAEHGVVYISELLKWYGTDFAPTPVEQIRKLRPFFPDPASLAWIDSPGLKVKYLRYDWRLNDQHPVPPTLFERMQFWRR
ncbi:MAG: DUF547 domain-containing protein [Gemmatales bacterium]|nr:MAG: DUF547 domain-containing protein [Gemmatales bacterium]